MRTTRVERTCAEQISAAVDQLIGDPDAPLGRPGPDDAGLLLAARQLARLPALLGPVDPALEQRVMGQIQARNQRMPWSRRFRPGWAVAGAVVALLVAMLLTPLGQTAVAGFMAVFSLGRTEVRITPAGASSAPLATAAAQSTAVQQTLALNQAQAQVAFPISQPAYRPPGYHLLGVNSYTYPDLPAWIPQPFFLELVYRDGSGREFILRLYPIVLGDQASISGLNLQAAPIRDVQDVDVNGQPGVLLQLGSKGADAVWQEVVWEQGDLILSLSATDLTQTDLLRVARSVR